MKYTFLILASWGIFFSCNNKDDHKKQADNTAQISQNRKTVTADFDEISVSESISAEVIKADTEKVTLYGPEDQLRNVLVDIDNGRLRIHYKDDVSFLGESKVHAKIFVKDFTVLHADSSAEIVVRDKFIQNRTDVNVSSSGIISGNLEANDFTINASSSGSYVGKIWAVNLNMDLSSASSANLSGKVQKAKMTISSDASVSGKDLVIKDLEANASSSASAVIGVSESVKAEASSDGSIEIVRKGNITSVNHTENSGGSVRIK